MEVSTVGVKSADRQRVVSPELPCFPSRSPRSRKSVRTQDTVRSLTTGGFQSLFLAASRDGTAAAATAVRPTADDTETPTKSRGQLFTSTRRRRLATGVNANRPDSDVPLILNRASMVS